MTISTALVAFAGVLLGATVTGLFVLFNGNRTREEDLDRWSREAEERRRTRFHDDRLAAYSAFLAKATNAFAFERQQALKRRSATVRGESPPAVEWPADLSRSHPEVNADALRQFGLQDIAVQMLAGSDAVREAAKELTRLQVQVFAFRDDHADWNRLMDADDKRWLEAFDRFAAAARAELAQ